jgi:hypothetical protein
VAKVRRDSISVSQGVPLSASAEVEVPGAPALAPTSDRFGGAVRARKKTAYQLPAVAIDPITGESAEAAPEAAPPNPKPMLDDTSGQPTPVLVPCKGSLFGTGPAPDDIHQGAAGDCYLLSTLASLAETHPEVLQQLVKDNKDGTYTVTFYKRDPKTHAYVKSPVTVDGELYVTKYAGTPPQQMLTYDNPVPPSWGPKVSTPKLWASLVEKAYAQFKGGSYDAIGHGGWPHNAMADLLGRPSKSFSTLNTPQSTVWANLKAAVDAKLPICASTSIDPKKQAVYTNSGLVGSHAYTVTGYEVKGGIHYVKLRNPWGNTEPGNDGKDDGNFEIRLTSFMKYYDVVDYSPAPVTPTPAPTPAPPPSPTPAPPPTKA